MNKTLLSIAISAILGGLIGSYATVNYFTDFASLNNNNLQNPVSQILGQKESGDKNISLEDKTQNTVIDVVNKVSPSVVSIIIEKDTSQRVSVDPFFEDFFRNWPGYNFPEEPEGQDPNWQKVGGGTGFIISSDGYILTNRHVIDDDSARYKVVLNDGSEYEASLVGTDLFNDIGALKIDANDLPTVELGDSDQLVIGQSVIAIGNALSEFSNTVTTGVVSGIGRSIVASGSGSSEKLEDVIQTDAAINPGNSGGPLLNLSGQVVGINTAVSNQGQLIGFAIPINSAKSIISSIKESGEIVRPYLGVRYMMLNEQIVQANNLEVDQGALIVRGDSPSQLAIVPGSPADKAGLTENDIILEVGGEKLTQDKPLAKVISQYRPGDKVKIKVWSKGETKEIEVTLEKYQN